MTTFTDRFVRGLKPAAKFYEVRDAGCRGLVLRVGQRGLKVWEVVVSRDGKRRRVRLGTYPGVSLATARRLASEYKSGSAVYSTGFRVRDLWEVYRAEIAPKRRAFSDVEKVWRKWAEPVVGNVRLDDLNMRHGAELIAHVVKHSTTTRARNVIRYISPMFGFAAGRGLIPGNPWRGLYLPPGPPPRDRVLSREEWLCLWEWGQGAAYPWGALLRALMLSAQRLGEVSGMCWDEINGNLWVIPAARHKSKRRHEVPLSAALVRLLATLPRHDAHVFSTRPGRAVAPGSTLKNRIATATGVSNWRFHDIRRTGATMMAEGGVQRFIIERVLGHVETSVTSIYDRHHYREEKLAALEVLAKTLK